MNATTETLVQLVQIVLRHRKTPITALLIVSAVTEVSQALAIECTAEQRLAATAELERRLIPAVRKYDQTTHQAARGDWFKVFRTVHKDGSFRGYVWAPVSCFLATSWRGPFNTEAEAIVAGKRDWVR